MQVTKQFVMGLVIIGLLFAPVAVTRAQQVRAAPSQAVALVARSNVVILLNRIRAGNANAVDYADAAASLRALFANWDETGFTAKLQAAFLANASSFASPSPELIHKMYLSERQAGVTENESDVAARYSGHSAADVSNAVAYISAHGVEALDAAFIQALNQKALTAAAGVNPRMRTVQSSFCFYLALFGLYASVLGVMQAASVIDIPGGILTEIVGLVADGGTAWLCT
ncbi:MAG: hypothetical protein ACRD4X_11760 [Candidatus Acidiferrales bacterium]